MAAPTANYPPKRSRKGNRARDYWDRLTEGLQVSQLWGQVKADARATYSFYAHDVDWQSINRDRSWKRYFRAAWAMFQAMLMKLTPARRVLLLIAIILLVVNGQFRLGGTPVSFDFSGIGALILFLLLALELADRVTMKRDLEIAREIQHQLVPEYPPSFRDAEIAFASRPQNTVAGDYYDAFARANGDAAAAGEEPFLFVVADVAGKSVPAALLMATFQASLRSLAERPGSLDDLARDLNRYACDHSLFGLRFTTAFIAQYEPATRALQYINAGHNAPLLRRSLGAIERLTLGGFPFGIESVAVYRAESISILPGDLLVIFTDGVVEAVNSAGEEYGETRLERRVSFFANESAAAVISALMGDVDAFVGAARQHDDITCMALRFR